MLNAEKEKRINKLKKIRNILLICLLIDLLILAYNFVPQFLLDKVAKHYIHHNNYAKAEKCYKAITVFEYKTYKNINHTNPEWYNELAKVYVKDKKYNLAILNYQKAISIYKAKKYCPEAYHGQIAYNLNMIGNIYLLMNEPKKAEKLYLNATSLLIDTYGYNNPQTISMLLKLKSFYHDRGSLTKEKNITKQLTKIKGLKITS